MQYIYLQYTFHLKCFTLKHDQRYTAVSLFRGGKIILRTNNTASFCPCSFSKYENILIFEKNTVYKPLKFISNVD